MAAEKYARKSSHKMIDEIVEDILAKVNGVRTRAITAKAGDENENRKIGPGIGRERSDYAHRGKQRAGFACGTNVRVSAG
jgi:hypothetical protein